MPRDYAKRPAATSGRQSHQQQSHAGLWIFTIVLFITFTLGLVFLGKYRQHHHAISSKNKTTTTVTTDINTQPSVATTEEAIRIIATSGSNNKNGSNKSASKNSSNANRSNRTNGKPTLPNKQQQKLSAQLQSPLQPQKLQFEFTTPEALEKAAAQKIATENKIAAKAQTESSSQAIQSSATAQAQQQAAATAGATSSTISATLPAPTPAAEPISNVPEQYLLDVIKTKNFAMMDKLRAQLALVGYEATVVTLTEKNSSYYQITLGPYEKDAALAKQKSLASNKIRATLRKL